MFSCTLNPKKPQKIRILKCCLRTPPKELLLLPQNGHFSNLSRQLFGCFCKSIVGPNVRAQGFFLRTRCGTLTTKTPPKRPSKNFLCPLRIFLRGAGSLFTSENLKLCPSYPTSGHLAKLSMTVVVLHDLRGEIS